MQTFQTFTTLRKAILDGTICFGKDTFMVTLHGTGFSLNLDASSLSALSGQVASGTVTFTTSTTGGVGKVSCGTLSITSATAVEGEYAVISKNGYGNGISNPLVGVLDLGGTVALEAGGTLTMAFPSGLLNLA